MSNKKTDFWYYTRRERQATASLLIIAVLLFLLPAVYDFRSPKQLSPTERTAIIELAEALETTVDRAPPKVATAFYFDPNTADQEVLLALGLPEATASTIINYRNKIGPFRAAEELQKIYNLAPADYQRLAPFIRIQPLKPKQAVATPKKRNQSIALFTFDPNTASMQEFLQLGLAKKTANNLIKYREKGGSFRRKEDLKKIYGLDEKDYQRLEAYITIQEFAETRPDEVRNDLPDTPREPKVLPASYSSFEPVKVDINQASAADWQKLYGIGPVLSARIVKFRDKLGGFFQIEQVGETYGLPDSTFQLIRSKLQSSPLIKKIRINQATAKELQAHPYIRWQQADVLVAYREEHGPFRNLADLKKVLALNDAFIDRLTPYLSFD